MKECRFDSLLQKYERNRVIRGLIQLIPFGIGSAIDVVVAKTVENIREERAKVFFDELAKDDTLLNESLLESEDFLHCYFATAKFALNSRRREKIKMFARLLKSSITEEGPQGVDEYEDFLAILDELGYRELQALSILDDFWERFQNIIGWEWFKNKWDEFTNRLVNELNVPSGEVTPFMNRISRTGCYEIFTGTYTGHPGGFGKITPTYQRLKGFIMQQSK